MLTIINKGIIMETRTDTELLEELRAKEAKKKAKKAAKKAKKKLEAKRESDKYNDDFDDISVLDVAGDTTINLLLTIKEVSNVARIKAKGYSERCILEEKEKTEKLKLKIKKNKKK
jgi:hypothetical protein